MKLISKVYVPRHGILEELKAGDPREIGRSIFYSTLKSLDLMGSIRRVGFANDSVIASELVKFLALNTEFDTIKNLADENVKIRQECEDVKKDAKEATKSASTLSNKLDDLKRYVEGMNKRLKTAESKQ